MYSHSTRTTHSQGDLSEATRRWGDAGLRPQHGQRSWGASKPPMLAARFAGGGGFGVGSVLLNIGAPE